MVVAFVCATAAVVVLALAIALINSRGTVAALTRRYSTFVDADREAAAIVARAPRDARDPTFSLGKSPPTKKLFPATLEGGN